MTAPPAIRPSRNGGCRSESLTISSSRPPVRAMMIEKIIVVAPTTAVPMSTGLAVALKVLPAPSFSSRKSLALPKSGVEAEVLLDLGLDAGDVLDGGQLVDGLRVVGDRAVGVDGDGHRAHAEEAEGHQAEREDGRGDHERAEPERAETVGDPHQADDGDAQPVGRRSCRRPGRRGC
jgi:hypothetical protein